MEIYLEDYGRYLHIENGLLVIRNHKEGEIIQRISFDVLQRLVLNYSMSLTTDVLYYLIEICF